MKTIAIYFLVLLPHTILLSQDSLKQLAYQYVDDLAPQLVQFKDSIGKWAEPSFEEFRTSQLLKEQLQRAGFRIEHKAAGIETMFVATYGQSGPTIALLGEYDADVLENGETAHASGHHWLGVGSLGAALVLKQLVATGQLDAQIQYIGSTAEGGLGGRSYLARNQYFKKLDLAIFWHPSPVSWASTRSWDALIDLDLAFIGTKEKAIEVPKSTTNALQESLYFMQYLNDLVINADSTMHIHYNLETPKASYIYTADTVTAKVRIQSTEQAVANQVYQLIQDKVKQRSTVADCKISLSLFRAIHAFIPNHTLMEVVNRNILKMGPINFSEEEQHQSRQIQAQFSLPTQGLKAKPLPFRATKEKQQLRKYASDIGDVSWWAPTLSFVSTCFPTGIPIGEAPAAELAFHSFGEKGMCYAVKVICASVIDYLQDEQLQQAIKEEFRQRLAGQSYSIQQPDIHPKAETNNKRSK